MERWWSPSTVALLTGANKGIGFAIAKGLAQQGLTTVLTARNETLGKEAEQKLHQEGLTNVVFHQLDITDVASIDRLSSWLSSSYPRLHILVNNAGFAYKGNVFGAEEAKKTIDINYRGTRRVCERLVPLMVRSAKQEGRGDSSTTVQSSPAEDAHLSVVNVSSRAGRLSILSPELQAKFSDPDLSESALDALVQDFVDSIKAGNYRQKGWPASMYGVSKVAMSAYTRILARQQEKNGVCVNACCPGYVATDMSSWGGTKTTEEGADTPIFLALHPPGTGGMYRERKHLPF